MTNKIQTARQPRFGFDRNSPVGRFWRWWSGELRALIPDWVLQSAGSAGNILLVEFSSHAIVLRRWHQDGPVEQGRLNTQSGDNATQGIAFQALITKLRKRDDQIALWLSDDQCLVKHIDLPLAAAENLRQVLSFEMDRHTPFKAEQVYFDFRIVRRDGENNRISVKLVVAPRSEVDAALDALMRKGFPAQAVYVSGATLAGEEMIDLMPVERRVKKLTTVRMINLALLGAVVLLTLIAIAVPILQKRQVVRAMVPLVESAKQQAEATDALRREWDKRSNEFNFVLDKKQAIPPVVAQIDELARLLPDDTWVQHFDLRGKELQIQGETASASKLIALVESARMLSDASFRSPLTKGSQPNSERFHLAATVKPLPASALAAPVASAALPPAAPAAPIVSTSAPAPAPQAIGKSEPARSNNIGAKPASTPAQPTAAPAAPPSQPEPGKMPAKPNQAVPPPNAVPPANKTPEKPNGRTPPARGAP